MSIRLPLLLLALLCLSALPAYVAAADAPMAERANTILVLDASGSMWGQIDGVNKIVIARDVVNQLLSEFPADQNLGLTAYGHRRRGDCSDIETLVAPGADTLPAISEAVNAINPRGRTPMTDAIISAAEALRYTEERATVILVSDGIETCNPDPCAAATALEEAGIDFTAHVVGFDVTDPEALAQMQCLAENTGGTFTTASNAAELTAALTTVAVAPEPALVDVTFEARLDSEDGPLVEGPVLWSFAPEPDTVSGEQEGNGITVSLAQGSFEVTAYWAAGETEVSRQFVATPDRTLVIVFESPPLTATLTAPERAEVGATIEVAWQGPNLDRDAIGITLANSTSTSPHRHASGWTFVSNGNPLAVKVPTEPGQYVIEYALGQDRSRIAAVPLEVVAVEAQLIAPETVTVGETFDVSWSGPAYDRDALGITLASSTSTSPHRHSSGWTMVSNGNPLAIRAPTQPGQYVIEYALGQDRSRLVSVPLEVVAAEAQLIAPETVTVGETFEVSWTGPNYDRDALGITLASSTSTSPHRHSSGWTMVSNGNPLAIRAPTEPGQYVIEYALGQDRRRLVSVPLEVVAVEAQLIAPASVKVGQTFEVSWTGPNYDRDALGITLASSTSTSPHRHSSGWTMVSNGNPLAIRAPTQPGQYVIEYALGQGRARVASVPLEVMAVEATLTAPASGAAGSMIEVAWTGPAYDRDALGVTLASSTSTSPHRHSSGWTFVSNGNPLQIKLPDEPGQYVIEYALGQDRSRLVSVPITVE